MRSWKCWARTASRDCTRRSRWPEARSGAGRQPWLGVVCRGGWWARAMTKGAVGGVGGGGGGGGWGGGLAGRPGGGGGGRGGLGGGCRRGWGCGRRSCPSWGV